MKTVLILISLNLVGFYSQAQQTEYNQVLTQESYNLACKPNSDGSMNCVKVTKVETQPVIKEKDSGSSLTGFILGGIAVLLILLIVYGLFSGSGSSTGRRCSCR